MDWVQVFKEMAPFLSFSDRYDLIEVSGTSGVNPSLLLASAIYYRNEKTISFKGQMKDISGRLMNAFFISSNRTKQQKSKENNAVHGLSLFVEKYSANTNCSSCVSKQTNELIAILKAVMAEAEKYQKTSIEVLSSEAKKIKRSASEETNLRFPFRLDECWMLSATHHSSRNCNATSCPKSSIDLAPNLFMGFGFTFEYFHSKGEVVAAHSGTVHVISPCKLSVRSSYFATFYGHITISRKSGEYVEVGEQLGFIDINSETSNCNCEVWSGNRECAIGPHLHWEVRDASYAPIDLNEFIINGFEIHTGSESYDLGCGPQNCHTNMTIEEIKHSCSTVYRRISDNAIFCPNKQGANWGMF